MLAEIPQQAANNKKYKPKPICFPIDRKPLEIRYDTGINMRYILRTCLASLAALTILSAGDPYCPKYPPRSAPKWRKASH